MATVWKLGGHLCVNSHTPTVVICIDFSSLILQYFCILKNAPLQEPARDQTSLSGIPGSLNPGSNDFLPHDFPTDSPLSFSDSSMHHMPPVLPSTPQEPLDLYFLS